MAAPARHLAAQSVHLTIHPPPRSLSESKLVLSALQKYGEVVTFRNLKYDKTNTNPTAPKNTIAVFDSPLAAKSAIANSPLTIPLPSLPSSSASTSASASASLSFSPFSSASASSSSRPRSLTCTLQPSRHNHLSALHRNPCYGGFVVEKDSYQAVDLRRTGVPVAELADVPVRWKPALGRGRTGMRCRMGGVSLQGMYESGIDQDGNHNGDGGGEKAREGEVD